MLNEKEKQKQAAARPTKSRRGEIENLRRRLSFGWCQLEVRCEFALDGGRRRFLESTNARDGYIYFHRGRVGRCRFNRRIRLHRFRAIGIQVSRRSHFHEIGIRGRKSKVVRFIDGLGRDLSLRPLRNPGRVVLPPNPSDGGSNSEQPKRLYRMLYARGPPSGLSHRHSFRRQTNSLPRPIESQPRP